MNNLKKAFQYVKYYPTLPNFSGGLQLQTIKCAEKKLNVMFPLSFRKFLKDKGAGDFGSLEVYGLVRDENFEKFPYTGSVPNLYWLTVDSRKNFNLPHHIILISDIGDGSYYALDLSQMNNEQECPVIVWPVGGYDETPELEIVAPDFGTWFLQQVEEQIKYHKNT